VPTTAAAADPSTRRLSEVARHVVVPTGIVDTLWFEVEEQCAEWGDEFDAWQDGLGQLVLGLRADGLFAASIGGVTLSIPRQVAKTFIVGRIVFAICARYPNTTVLWTAHRTRMATQTFEKLKAFAKRPAVRTHLAKTRNDGMRDSHGEQEIRFGNDSVIMFGAREQGFGRGFDEVDVEVFDEAQILTEKALEDMIAATNQSRFPHGALLFYMGTPPRPTDPGEEFTNRRRKALSAKPDDVVYAEHGDAMYVECSADPSVGKPDGPSLDDPEQVSIANPSYPHRTPPVSVARLRENLTSDDSWRREGLGVWDEFDGHVSAIPLDQWAALAIPDEEVPQGAPDRYALTMSPERVASIAVALKGEAADYVDLAQLERVDDSRKLVDWLVARCGRRTPVMIDSRDPAASFVNELRTRGVKVNVTSASDAGRACGGLLDAVNEGRVWHCDQPTIASALRVAAKRDIGKGGLWEWDLDDLTPEVAALRALTLAHYGLSFTRHRSANKTSGRRVVTA